MKKQFTWIWYFTKLRFATYRRGEKYFPRQAFDVVDFRDIAHFDIPISWKIIANFTVLYDFSVIEVIGIFVKGCYS